MTKSKKKTGRKQNRLSLTLTPAEVTVIEDALDYVVMQMAFEGLSPEKVFVNSRGRRAWRAARVAYRVFTRLLYERTRTKIPPEIHKLFREILQAPRRRRNPRR